MKSYIGTKIVSATPEAKDGRHGYAVVYEDGYRSWSPIEAFEKAYAPFDTAEMNFSQAMHMLLECGAEVARESMDGYISLVNSGNIDVMHSKTGAAVPLAYFIAYVNGDDAVAWLPNTFDMLAEDWYVCE